MTFKTIALATVLFVTAVGAALPAGAQPMGPGWGGGRPDAPWRERFATLDTNHDGVITKAEFVAGAGDVFAAMDADSSGDLTKDEFMAVRMGPQWGGNPDRMAAMQAQKAGRFSAMDTNGDGRASRAEFMAEHEREFAAMDRNGDGRVIPAEFRGRHW